MKFFIGVDPGVSGAIAVTSSTLGLIQVIDMPTVEVKVGKSLKRRISPELLMVALREVVTPDCVAMVEQVRAMPGQGVSSMFAFGEAYGLIRGVLAGLGVRTHTVTPVSWKKEMALNKGKDASRAMAAQLWPDQAGLFARVKDDGRAEAALIAEFARRKFI